MIRTDITTSDYMTFVLTHQCNRDCPFCIDQYRGRDEFMTESVFEHLLGYARGAGVKEILFVGGEPLLHPNIVEYAKRVKDLGFTLILTTSGHDMDLLSKLGKICDHVNLSNYGANLTELRYGMFRNRPTVSTLLWKGRFETKRALDNYIKFWDIYADMKFKTMEDCTDWTHQNLDVSDLLGWITDKDTEYFYMFDEVKSFYYRNSLFMLYGHDDRPGVQQSLKGHVDGEISRSWTRSNVQTLYI